MVTASAAKEAAQALTNTVSNAVQNSTHSPQLLGESIGFWIQTLAIILTAIFAAWAVYSSRQMVRKKNSADVIFTSKGDEKLRKGITVIKQINADENSDISKLAYSNAENLDDGNSVCYVLNFYEYVAVGIKRGIYDESILKDSSYTTVINMYELCKPYIETVRRVNQRTTTWCELEKMANNWLADPIKNHHSK